MKYCPRYQLAIYPSSKAAYRATPPGHYSSAIHCDECRGWHLCDNGPKRKEPRERPFQRR